MFADTARVTNVRIIIIIIIIGFTFLVSACPGCPGEEAIKRVWVSVWLSLHLHALDYKLCIPSWQWPSSVDAVTSLSSAASWLVTKEWDAPRDVL